MGRKCSAEMSHFIYDSTTTDDVFGYFSAPVSHCAHRPHITESDVRTREESNAKNPKRRLPEPEEEE